jgi:hypothetical protein
MKSNTTIGAHMDDIEKQLERLDQAVDLLTWMTGALLALNIALMAGALWLLAHIADKVT